MTIGVRRVGPAGRCDLAAGPCRVGLEEVVGVLYGGRPGVRVVFIGGTE